MVNIICLFAQEGSVEVPNIRWEMCAPRLCYHNSFSDGEWLVAAARAPRHMLHTVPVEPMTHNPQYLEGGGVCSVVLYGSIMNGNKSSQLSCS